MNVVNNTRADVIARGVLMGVEAAGRKPRGDNQSLSRPRQLGGGSAGDNGGGRRRSVRARDVVRCAARLAVEKSRAHIV